MNMGQTEITEMLPLLIGLVVILLGLLVLYFVLLVRAILQMLSLEVNRVLLVFAFISLIFTPFTLLLGINVIIIWRFHKKELRKTGKLLDDA